METRLDSKIEDAPYVGSTLRSVEEVQFRSLVNCMRRFEEDGMMRWWMKGTMNELSIENLGYSLICGSCPGSYSTKDIEVSWSVSRMLYITYPWSEM
jgi:hypothetical protein